MSDPDEAAGHLSAGTAEPDEDVAATAKAAAGRLARRGAVSQATRRAEAALALTPEPDGLPAWRRRIMMLDLLERSDEVERGRTLIERWTALDPQAEVYGHFTFFRGLLTRTGPQV